MRQTACEAVIHFAAFIAVGESMREPERYFANNVGGLAFAAHGDAAERA